MRGWGMLLSPMNRPSVNSQSGCPTFDLSSWAKDSPLEQRIGRLQRERATLLPPGATVAGFSVLVANDNDENARLERPIHDGVGKNAQRKYATAFCGGCAEARMRDQEPGHTFKLVQESLSNQQASPLPIEIRGVSNVLLGTGMKRIRHRASLARRRFMASCPGTSTMAPDSNEASLRSASNAQASSTVGSTSRLAIRRSRRCERSAGASFRASDSRTSRLVLMLISDAIGGWCSRPGAVAAETVQQPFKLGFRCARFAPVF